MKTFTAEGMLLAFLLAACGNIALDPPNGEDPPATAGSSGLAGGTGMAGAGEAGVTQAAFNKTGNILIADRYNNRAIEVASDGTIVWQFGLGPNDVSEKTIVGVSDVQRVGDYTLMTGAGAPPGSEPMCDSGCLDNRVLLVDRNGRIIWQYGQFGVTGAGHDQLSSPIQSTWLPYRNILITDRGNQRVIEVSPEKEIVWQYGTTGISGSGFNQLNNPGSAELLVNGRILISDSGNDRAIEVDRDGNVIAAFTAGGTVSGVAFASRLPGGNTLLSDSRNNRIVEVDPGDRVVWEFATNLEPGSHFSPETTRGIRLKNGNTIISDQNNHRVIMVNTEKAVAASFGPLNRPGYGASHVNQGLNNPYDAKVIGDYTGLTPPAGYVKTDFMPDRNEKYLPSVPPPPSVIILLPMLQP